MAVNINECVNCHNNDNVIRIKGVNYEGYS